MLVSVSIGFFLRGEYFRLFRIAEISIIKKASDLNRWLFDESIIKAFSKHHS
jgi:hypothetical protein